MSEFVPNTIALRMGLGHPMESFIVERQLCACALTDCSGPTADSAHAPERSFHFRQLLVPSEKSEWYSAGALKVSYPHIQGGGGGGAV